MSSQKINMQIRLDMSLTQAFLAIDMLCCEPGKTFPLLNHLAREVATFIHRDGWTCAPRFPQEVWLSDQPFTNKASYFGAVVTATSCWSVSRSSVEVVKPLIITNNTKAESDLVDDLGTRCKVFKTLAVSLLREYFGSFGNTIILRAAPSPAKQDIPLLREMSKDAGNYPVMADAAEDAGFQYMPALNHLRDRKQKHAGRCWAALMAIGDHPCQKGSRP